MKPKMLSAHILRSVIKLHCDADVHYPKLVYVVWYLVVTVCVETQRIMGSMHCPNEIRLLILLI